jgi:hypothetical protein
VGRCTKAAKSDWRLERMTVGRMEKREEGRRKGRWRNEIGNDKRRRRRSVSESPTLVTTADGPKRAQDVFI